MTETLFTESGRRLVVDCELARGGEGVLLTVEDAPDIVVKRWHDAIERDPVAVAQVARTTSGGWPTAGGHGRLVAPRELVLDASGRLVGVVLPRLHGPINVLGDALPLIGQPGSGYVVTMTWRLRVATRVADIAARAHGEALVLGDFGPHNLTIDIRAARIVAFDVDAWQPLDAARPRRVGVDVATPELLAGAAPVPTLEADRFALALSVLLILCAGRHPFDGIPLDGSRRHALVEDNLASGHSHLSRLRPLRATEGAPRIETLPPRLRPLAEAALVAGHGRPELRPPAVAWLAALREEEGRR
jgi:DNA-binding helix-hairpin-helix protein with protein kinase domain